MTPDLLPARIARKIEVSETGCWLWTAATNTNGYGNAWWDGRVQPAHRVVYSLLVGPIPEGLDLDHRCRVRPCCNPVHLNACTRRENLLAPGSLALVADQVKRTHCPKGHEYTEANTVRDRGTRRCRTCKNEQQNERARAKRLAR